MVDEVTDGLVGTRVLLVVLALIGAAMTVLHLASILLSRRLDRG
ncbi:hypothetical protein GCM10025868_36520 [Angustibacter aerolatus]|uniref:Uncharacterized protein n=1 Tax=Angustibacter aerolatus TaxID=1162965 RepID=A0ABQ6JKU3_9ACTN|nr:hypothetical protein GCM10025868_36520 [Angustibacter aerolatus]